MKLKRAEEVAKKLGIATETFLGWRDLGMPYVKIGKSLFILEDSFLRWARDHEIENGDKNEKPETDRSKQGALSLVSKI